MKISEGDRSKDQKFKYFGEIITLNVLEKVRWLINFQATFTMKNSYPNTQN